MTHTPHSATALVPPLYFASLPGGRDPHPDRHQRDPRPDADELRAAPAHDDHRAGNADALRLDLQYIDNWSLWLDLKILLRTIPAVLNGAGAR